MVRFGHLCSPCLADEFGEFTVESHWVLKKGCVSGFGVPGRCTGPTSLEDLMTHGRQDHRVGQTLSHENGSIQCAEHVFGIDHAGDKGGSYLCGHHDIPAQGEGVVVARQGACGAAIHECANCLDIGGEIVGGCARHVIEEARPDQDAERGPVERYGCTHEVDSRDGILTV